VARFPLTLRALLLVPLIAATVDQVRASVVCATPAQSCLETVGGGSFGVVGVIVLLAYALGVAVVVGRLAARRGGIASRWMVGAAGLAALCGGQALLIAALGDGGALGGGWLELLALCGAAGGLLALALRVAPAALAFVRSLRPAAPRLRPAPLLVAPATPPLRRRSPSPLAKAAAGRAPPLTLA
jgi:hypothetical protein